MHLPHTHPSLGFPLMPSPASLCLCLSAEHRLRNADDMGGADAFRAVAGRSEPPAPSNGGPRKVWMG